MNNKYSFSFRIPDIESGSVDGNLLLNESDWISFWSFDFDALVETRTTKKVVASQRSGDANQGVGGGWIEDLSKVI